MIRLADDSGPLDHARSKNKKATRGLGRTRSRSNSQPDLESNGSAKSGYESSSSSDMDGIAEELDQIGRLSWPTGLLKDNLPNLPNFPGFPSLGTLPQLPSFDLPSIDLSDVSKSVSQYINAWTGRMGGMDEVRDPTVLNSMKTAVATKIQMNTFLQDLGNGRSLQGAIERLQPLTNLIHEVITLPVDGDDEMDREPDQVFEPEGVGEIVNREQPLLTTFVPPDGEKIDGFLDPTRRSRRERHKHMAGRSFKRAGSVFSDDGTQTGSDLEYVDELTPEEARALTHLDSIADFYKEDLLRQKIQKIQSMPNLSQVSKNKLVTRLMMGNYYKYINEKLSEERGISLHNQAGLHLPGDKQEINRDEDMASMVEEEVPEADSEEVEDDEVVLTAEDTLPSYYDEENKILGCAHYQRNCKLECPTCLKWYTCRFCHDKEVTDHKLQRNCVKHILCMKCNAPQVPDNSYCVNCDEELANYFCSKCVLYDNDPNKDIYHCDKCGICRLGLGIGKDFFHCDECNICLSIDLKEHHRCVTNTTHCNCPICNEYLFTSVSKVVFMKCGHSIHQACYDEMVKHSYKCPVCKKTVVNVETQFRILDQEIRQSPLPPPYNMWRCIISCNDCKGKSSCQYHVLGLKCKYCQSYNTNQLKLIKPEEESLHNSDDEASDDDNDRLATMRLMQTNLSSNFNIDEQTTENNTEQDTGYNSEAEESDDPEGGASGSIVNFRRLTKSLLGKREKDVDRASITAVFQKFINSTIAEGATEDAEADVDEADERSEMQSESDMESDADILGGF